VASVFELSEPYRNYLVSTQAVGVPRFDIVTTVPGTRPRDEEHPLVRIVGTLVGQTRDRYQPVLTLGPDASVEGRAVLANRYRATQAMAAIRPSC
jgi:hypothetical protein